MTVSKSTIKISLFLIVLAGLALYNFIGAQTWTAPSATPPVGNVAAPFILEPSTKQKLEI